METFNHILQAINTSSPYLQHHDCYRDCDETAWVVSLLHPLPNVRFFTQGFSKFSISGIHMKESEQQCCMKNSSNIIWQWRTVFIIGVFVEHKMWILFLFLPISIELAPSFVSYSALSWI